MRCARDSTPPGGLLWFQPTVKKRTAIPEADIPPTRVDDVKAGKEESSLAAAVESAVHR